MVRLATHAMGTRFEIALWGEDEVGLRAVGEECLREIELWHGRLSRFAPDSDAMRLSRDPSARLDGEMAGLLALCERVREGSGGAFDPWRVLSRPSRLSRPSTEGTEGCTEVTEDEVWRGEDDPSSSTQLHPLPSSSSPPILASSSASSVRPSVTSVAPAVPARSGPDFGAVGKGWALDRAIGILREHGVTTALLHGGTSSVVAIGSPPGADGWRVDVASDGGPLRKVLRDRVMGVSAPRGRRDERGDGHIVDPRTGAAASRVDTAVVIGPVGEDAAALCDAWSTALVVMGDREMGVDCTGIKMPVPPGIAVPPGFEAYIHTSSGWHNLTPTLTGTT